ncbi:MAG TPA: hypothetical protein VFF04_06605 [Candidatus Babeliales bacterium]|nr:hypothetical protein [Candidatus Babeliales bacterium]
MKSIVEEASSVMKAIEKGWVQAGKPQEFSVKVFETEQKNFLGMTTKSAKIAIFFGDKVGTATRTERTEKKDLSKQREQRQPQKPQRQKPFQTQTPEVTRQEKTHEEPRREERKEQSPRETWSPDMVNAVESWVSENLQLMNLGSKTFSVEVKNYYLKINFDQPLFEDSEREKIVFRSFAHLIMQSLRNKFKKGFRGFKVILNSSK